VTKDSDFNSTKSPHLVGGPEIRERKRGQKDSTNFLESLGIDLSQIQVQINLNPEDKAMLKDSLEKMGDDVKKYWTRTHILMVVIAAGSLLAQVISW